MSMLWPRLRDLLARDGTARDGRSGNRPIKASPAGDSGAVMLSWYWVVGMAVLLLVLHLFLFPPVPRLSVVFPVAGEIADTEIRAPFTFQAPYLDRDVQMRQLEKVVVEPPVLRTLETHGGSNLDSRMEYWLESLDVQLSDTLSSVADRAGILSLQFSSVDPGDLRRLLRTSQPDSLVVRMERSWRTVTRVGVVDMLPAGRYDRVVILSPQAETLVDVDQVVTQANLEDRLAGALRADGLTPLESVQAAAVMRRFVIPQLVYADEETNQRQEEARQSVTTFREFISGERIVDRGVRVTEEKANFLAVLQTKILDRGGDDSAGGRFVRISKRTLLVALALAVFGLLGKIHFYKDLRRLRFLVALTAILAVYLVGGAVALRNPGLGPIAVPIALLSLLATVLFKGRVGYTTTILAVTLLAVLPDVTGGFVFAWFTMGMMTVVSVRRIQKRRQFYQTILLLITLSVSLVLLLGIGSDTGHDGWTSRYLVAFFAPVLTVAFGLFLLPLIEPLVGVCSDLTLLELSDLNHPLLMRMALEAQGTYHHSQVVGQLAEHAARAIDANALLTRVGALFHDIGKMQKPEYYAENQAKDSNKHDELSPSMSALVIAAHVKDGIELGRRWRLPQAIIDFIPQHHGTLIMEFFYHKALEAEGNETVKVDDFRYPGPKPASRETAILMLADAVEAATRSLAKPTLSRIKEITKQIMDKRMLNGELDESGLSLSDLSRIRSAFIPLLTGIHHSRIVYPGQRDRDAERVTERRGEKAGKRDS